jgi:SAM-dependent methyltransferase
MMVGSDKPVEIEAIADKAKVASFWGQNPCGSGLADGLLPGTSEFFEATEAARYKQEPFVGEFARFTEWKGKNVLEVGCGMGTDLSMFARHGAHALGLDLTFTGAALAARRLAHRQLAPRVAVADSESLPFREGMFDLVYSWGVIHHTPNTAGAARELVRVARPGGRVLAMIYNRHSLVALQAYLLYGVLQGKPFRPLKEIIASHLESPGTKAYTVAEARQIFASLDNVHITPVVTPYDLRIGRNRFLPSWVGAWVPRGLGYFLVIEGTKPVQSS